MLKLTIEKSHTMAKYKWSFANVGGVTRVRIQSAEDLRHLGELDKKMWTVLSCPVNGLEISSESLSLMDLDGDGKLRLKEVVATSEWLCATLKDPKSLFAQKDEIALDNIADAALLAVAKKIAGKKKSISLAEVQAVIDAITVPEQPVPAAPFEADVIAAYKEKSAEYAAYFEQEKLQKLGLALIPEDAVKPGMKEKDFVKMGAQITEWEAAKTAAEAAKADALAAAKAEFMPLRKLLLLHRDFCRLLRNFVTFEDFYSRKETASFACGTLIIDQRACHLCIQVNNLPKHDTQAPLSGIYLLYCNCESKKLGKSLQIIAAMTQGEVKNLSVGKNAVFYDNAGNDYDATVIKIIDNPISIRQAFWTPYRKFANWVEEKINKSAAEKDAKVFDDMTAKADAAVNKEGGEAPKPAFDIAKFAGIFAAIGMALGMIGTALAAVAKGLSGFTWWQLLIVFVCILIVISGPSMIMAWLKLRRRNLAPVLNANGWAINADAIISVLFGRTLTEQVAFPIVKAPQLKPSMAAWKKWLIALCIILVLIGIVCAILHLCGFCFSCCRFR